MIINAVILLAVTGMLVVLFHPKLAHARLWRASMTPLASIIGSGFLVLGPILDWAYGKYAPLMMAGLCAGAWLFGAAIRFNIAVIARDGGHRPRIERGVDTAASWALTFAYVISVAYYLNLFGAFGVSLTPFDDAGHARLLTSAMFLVVLLIGWARGFHALERVEQISVALKLAIIAGLLVGLVGFFISRANGPGLLLNPPNQTGWGALTLAFGLIVTVQGFETSRYLGADYDAALRIGSMRLAQAISAGIYLVYILLLAYVFLPQSAELSETAIIGMMGQVAPVLPLLLVAAALAAQFSAAVADTGGSGGLVAELTDGRLSPRQGYGALVALGLILTWSADVFQIITYASRAFALYYALQAVIAALAAWRGPNLAGGRNRWRALGFGVLAVLGFAIFGFAQAVEGGG